MNAGLKTTTQDALVMAMSEEFLSLQSKAVAYDGIKHMIELIEQGKINKESGYEVIRDYVESVGNE